MKKVLILAIAVAFITMMCASVSFALVPPGPPAPKKVTDPDNTMTGNPEKSGGVNMGSGNTDMNNFDNTGGMNGNMGGSGGSQPGTKLFGTFPKSGN